MKRPIRVIKKEYGPLNGEVQLSEDKEGNTEIIKWELDKPQPTMEELEQIAEKEENKSEFLKDEKEIKTRELKAKVERKIGEQYSAMDLALAALGLKGSEDIKKHIREIEQQRKSIEKDIEKAGDLDELNNIEMKM